MIVSTCQHESRRTNGVTKSGAVRYRCKLCGKSWTESTNTLGGMRIGVDQAAKVIQMLCEGVSVRATVRLTGVAKDTVLDLLVYVGERCETYMQQNIRGVFVGDTQVDEIWQYVFCKRNTARREKYVGGCGDTFCFTAIDRNTKLLVAWHMGRRTERHTDQFIAKLKAATAGHFHVSTDGWRSYPTTIKKHLGNRVDHGIMYKVFGRSVNDSMRHYSPPKIIGANRKPVHGDKYQQEQICTSHVERMNGSIRTFCKRMARLTYCFSKKWTNHRMALAVFFCHYNYCRKHATLKGMTPAMSHGLTTEVWTVRQMIEKVSA